MNVGSSQSRLRAVATTLAVAVTLTLAAAAGCDSRKEPDLSSVQEKLRETHIYGQSKLRIGVATNEPLMGELRNGQHVGFDVEIGRYVAASLGYEGDQRLEFVSVATEDRIPALQGGMVDLVVSSFSMTEERRKLVSFAGPYFVTTQEVMVRPDSRTRSAPSRTCVTRPTRSAPAVVPPPRPSWRSTRSRRWW
ncbi:transporter substrate-binding domain-containing protein [Micromonospora parastrephiae]|uniref:transporter substrate-binding domain-containing protein n=1 Tax=Micromonospora parastrephiae TaxID=2806101 RepID=UPI00210496B9|nr:transporter substrate-binding domain-containing protein [Micromonospora parastrephiae]